jgi:hypothetical protein
LPARNCSGRRRRRERLAGFDVRPEHGEGDGAVLVGTGTEHDVEDSGFDHAMHVMFSMLSISGVMANSRAPFSPGSE